MITEEIDEKKNPENHRKSTELRVNSSERLTKLTNLQSYWQRKKWKESQNTKLVEWKRNQYYHPIEMKRIIRVYYKPF